MGKGVGGRLEDQSFSGFLVVLLMDTWGGKGANWVLRTQNNGGKRGRDEESGASWENWNEGVGLEEKRMRMGEKKQKT